MGDGTKDGGTGPRDGAPLACAVCMKEIPPDVEHTLEGQEYVQHFCGLDCYRAWHERRGGCEAGKPDPPA